MKYLVIGLLIGMAACHAPERKKSVAEAVFVKDRDGDSARKEVVDSLRWVFYTVNFADTALPLSGSASLPKLRPVQCAVSLSRIKRDHDTCQYIFKVYKYSYDGRYHAEPTEYAIIWGNIVGIVTVKGLPWNLKEGHYLIYTPPASQAAADSFFKERETAFIQYMKSYKGELDPWLKSELARRGISTAGQ